MLPRVRSCLVVGALVAGTFLFDPSASFADRVDTVLALGQTTSGTIGRPDEVSTVAFLVSAGTKRKLALTVKPAKRSLLQPTVRIIDPNGAIVDAPASGGSVVVKGLSTTVKLPNVSVGGLWRIEVRGASGSTGAYLAIVKGKDTASASGAQVVPASGSFDVPLEVGANQALTVVARRGAGSRITPRIRILDTTGVAIQNGAFLGVSNTKLGTLTLKKFRLPSFGRYTVRFSGVDNLGGTVTFTAKTAPAKVKGAVPKAVPGPSLEADPSTMSRLDGSASIPAAGGALTYSWAQVGGPRVELTDANTASPAFVAPDDPSSLAFELSVAENGVLGLAVPVAVEVAPRPIADAGRSRAVASAAAVTLDGAGSTSRSGTPLTYSWRQDPADAQQVVLTDATTATPSFTAPATAGVLHFLLVVDDGVARSLEDSVVVAVGDPNRSVADAGRPQVVQRMSTVFLSGIASAVPGGVLGGDFEWVQMSGPFVALDGGTSAFASFTAPRQAAELVFDLVAGDLGTRDTVRVRVLAGETGFPPLARGSGPHFTAGGDVTVNASASSDPDGLPVAQMIFRWAQTDGAALTPSSPSAVSTTLAVPAGNETRSYAVQASDRLAYSAPDIVHVRTTGYTGKPVANAGEDVVGQGGLAVALDGRGSSRTQGTGPITYLWKQISGKDWFDVDAADAAFDPTVAMPSFTLPADLSSLASRRTLTFSLVVNDGTQSSAADFVTVSYANLPTNGLPTVTANATPTNPLPGTQVNLSATTFDRDGDPVTVRWVQISGTPVQLSSVVALNPTFTAPASGLLTFRVTPHDGIDPNVFGTPAHVSVTVDTAPTARPRATPTFGPPGTDVTIDGSQSTDPEGNPLTYLWTQTAGPTTTFSPTAQSFSFTSANGNYTFRLVVNDGRQNSPPATINFSGNQPPTVAPTSSVTAAPYGGNVNLFANAGGSGQMTFTWRQIREGSTATDPVVTLSNAASANASFTAPDTTSGQLGASAGATFGVIADNGAVSPEGTVRVTFYASYNNNASGTVTGAPSTTEYVYKAIGQCTSCHSGTSNFCPVGSGSNASGFGMGSASAFRSNSVSATACGGGKGTVRIAPNSSSTSYVVQRITGQVPPTMGSLTQKEIDLIKDWIDQGAKDN